MKSTEIIEALRQKLTVPSGRHLYGVLGAYSQLDSCSKKMHQAKTTVGDPFPKPVNVNRGILDAIPDDYTLPTNLIAENHLHPSELKQVKLIFQDGKLTSPGGSQAINQFSGRYYIGKLARTMPKFRDEYKTLGSVFWFDQMRNLGQSLYTAKDDENQPEYSETWRSGVEQLRELLVGWWAHHTSERSHGKDYIPDLEKKFNIVFSGVKFVGVAPRGTGAGGISDFYFLLDRKGKVFDISEMSSGEQAVFPLIYEFIRLDIAKSIVLIDELELHLHPPQQQALLAALPNLGPDCQFIITTHSSYLEGVIPIEHEVRLEGGHSCL